MGMREKFASFQAFAKRVLQLSAPYFQSEQKWRARGMFVAIVVRRPMGEEQRWPWMLGAGVALGLGLLVRPVTGALLLVLVGVCT